MPAGTSSVRSQPSARAKLTHAAAERDLAGQRVVVMGLGRFGGGIGSARWLAGHHARVVVTDLAGESALNESVAKLADLDIEYHLGGHDPSVLDGADLLVVNPAVSKDCSAFFQEALRRGIPWTTEVNLFLERCPATVIGVTGSAGKSTTSAMIHACLRTAGSSGDLYLGGNIGRSLLCDVHEMSPDDTVVLELSSFQLADLPRIERRPDIAVMVNVWAQHLDRHGSFASYFDCKLNMIREAKREMPVVVGFDDPSLVSMVEAAGRASAVRIIRASQTRLSVRPRVPGGHNALNARCAAAACDLAGVEGPAISRGIENFAGLAHRLQHVGRYAGVDYYNDSKATSPRTAAAALRAFDRPVIALIGGRATAVSCDELVSAIVTSSRATVCFGSGGDMVYTAVRGSCMGRESVELHRVEHISEAVALAGTMASEGDIVLLSPGFQSYDAFANYEQRGDIFTSLVRAMSADLK